MGTAVETSSAVTDESVSGKRPSTLYKALLLFLRTLVRCFFREVHVTGLEHVPKDRGGILVSWHPNGLVDPGLILTQFDRPVVFGARHGLFRLPLLGFMLRQLGTVPIYRKQDSKGQDRSSDNEKSLDALASQVANGSYSALFPEGISHDMPHLAELKTGVPRLYYQARALLPPGAPVPAIIPVGLHYDRKRVFRSRAVVWFHPPLEIPEDLDVTPSADEDLEISKVRCRALTDKVGEVLNDVVHGTDDWRIHHLLRRGRKLVRAERAVRAGFKSHRPGAEDKTLGFARIRLAYYERLQTHPERIAQLTDEIESYDRDLRALGLDDHDLDHEPRVASPWLPVLLLLQIVFVFLFLPPLLLVGYLVNGPPALMVLGLAKWGAKEKKDVATIKMLAGALLFPTTWVGAGFLAALTSNYLHSIYPSVPDQPIWAGLAVAFLAIVGGIASLRYLHVAQETIAAIRVRLTRARRREAIEALRQRRTALYEAFMMLAQGVTLPGVILADGSLKTSG